MADVLKTIKLKEAVVIPAPVAVPNAPTNFTATAVSHDQINLAWDAQSPVTTFQIELSTSPLTGPFVGGINVSGNLTSYAATGLAPITLYYFRIRAVNYSGASTTSSAQATTFVYSP